MDAIASRITSLTVDYSTVYSDADQRKHQSSVSLAFVRGIHRWPVDSPHKWPVTRKMFLFYDVIMVSYWTVAWAGFFLANQAANIMAVDVWFLASPRHQEHWYWLWKIFLFAKVNTRNANHARTTALCFDCWVVGSGNNRTRKQKMAPSRWDSNPRSPCTVKHLI